jgi:hypothetical protein
MKDPIAVVTALIVAPSDRVYQQFKKLLPNDHMRRITELVQVLGCRPTTACTNIIVINHDDLNMEQLTIVRELQRAGFKPVHIINI